MRNKVLVAISMLFAAESAFSQNSVVPPVPKPAAAAPMGAAAAVPHASQAKPEAARPEAKAEAKPAASTPEARSAAALALSSEPAFDEGSAGRIREAALSYSDIALRGGWPTTPAAARFALGAAGPHDSLLRTRLIVSGDLAADKPSGPYDDALAAAIKRFQARHGLAATGAVTPRTLAAL